LRSPIPQPPAETPGVLVLYLRYGLPKPSIEPNKEPLRSHRLSGGV